MKRERLISFVAPIMDAPESEFSKTRPDSINGQVLTPEELEVGIIYQLIRKDRPGAIFRVDEIGKNGCKTTQINDAGENFKKGVDRWGDRGYYELGLRPSGSNWNKNNRLVKVEK